MGTGGRKLSGTWGKKEGIYVGVTAAGTAQHPALTDFPNHSNWELWIQKLQGQIAQNSTLANQAQPSGCTARSALGQPSLPLATRAECSHLKSNPPSLQPGG